VHQSSRSSTRDISQGTDISRAAWRALAIGAAGLVLVGFNSTATNIAFDDITASFPTTPETTTAFVASGYFIGTAALLPLGGRIADRRGARSTFLVGLALFAVTALLSAVSPNVAVLIAARVLQAIAGALVIPASLSVVLPMFPESRRSTAVTSWAAAGPLSAAIAPSASAALLHVGGWRWLYALSAPIALAVLWTGRRTLEVRPVEPATGRIDVAGTVLGTLGIALLVFGVGKGNDWGFTSSAIIGCFAAAGVAVFAFVQQSRRHPQPLIDLELFKIRQVWMTNLANMFISVTSLSIWLVWPLYLLRIWDYSNFQVGLALTPGPIAAGCMSLLGGRIADRIGHRLPITIGSFFMVFSVMWCWLALDADGSFVTSFLPGIASFGFGWGLSSPTMNSYALEAVDDRYWGSMNAAFNMLRNVAGAVGAAAAVAFVGSRDRPDIVAAFDRAFMFFAGATILGALVIVLFYPSGRHSKATS